MKEYTVTYTIQIDANNPRQAAEKAFEYITDPEAVFSKVFTVSEPVEIDLFYEGSKK